MATAGNTQFQATYDGVDIVFIGDRAGKNYTLLKKQGNVGGIPVEFKEIIEQKGTFEEPTRVLEIEADPTDSPETQKEIFSSTPTRCFSRFFSIPSNDQTIAQQPRRDQKAGENPSHCPVTFKVDRDQLNFPLQNITSQLNEQLQVLSEDQVTAKKSFQEAWRHIDPKITLPRNYNKAWELLKFDYRLLTNPVDRVYFFLSCGYCLEQFGNLLGANSFFKGAWKQVTENQNFIHPNKYKALYSHVSSTWSKNSECLSALQIHPAQMSNDPIGYPNHYGTRFNY